MAELFKAKSGAARSCRSAVPQFCLAPSFFCLFLLHCRFGSIKCAWARALLPLDKSPPGFAQKPRICDRMGA